MSIIENERKYRKALENRIEENIRKTKAEAKKIISAINIEAKAGETQRKAKPKISWWRKMA
jgi:hypothetical protein